MQQKLWFSFLVLFTIIACNSNKEKNVKMTDLQSSSKEETIDQKIENIMNFFVGTYTRKEGHVDGKAEGIYVLDFNTLTGEISNQETIIGCTNPSYLAIHPSKKYLYAANEVGGTELEKEGVINVYEKTHQGWTLIQSQISGGNWPCHATINEDGEYLYVANYSGSWSTFIIRQNGHIEMIEVIKNETKKSTHPRQDGPHAHMCMVTKGAVFVADLGSDETMIFSNEEDEYKKIGSLHSALHAGPRHLDMNNDQTRAYVLNELSNTIDLFNIHDKKGKITSYQTIPAIQYKPEQGEQAASAIKMHPNQKFLYTASRGIKGSESNTIELFQIDQNDGQLTFIEGYDAKGLVPRDFAIDPTGKFLLVANQNSDNIVVYRIDQGTGKLIDTHVNYSIPTPVCLIF